MSKINEIERELTELNDSRFHKLMDLYLNKRHGYPTRSNGTKTGEDKSTTGTPDTSIQLNNGQYIFVEYTTQEKNIKNKFIEDIKKCLDTTKTGIKIEKIDKIILASNREINTRDIEALRQACGTIDCDVLTNSILSNDMYNHTHRIVYDFLGIKINEILYPKIPSDIQSYLQNSIEREIEKDIIIAIERQEDSVIILRGEEGIGKTVLSLQIAQRLPKEKYIIRFFKSHEWEHLAMINDLLFQNSVDNLEEIVQEEDKQIIIILDGVNERNALLTSVRLLEDYQSLSGDVRGKIKMVLTTRDLASYTDYQQYFWDIYKSFDVKKFSEDELQRAIAKIDSEYDYSMFPSELKKLASIPRYLSIVFRLKEKLKKYENITKEMLFWEGLKDQIRKDLKIRKQGITEDDDIEYILFNIIDSVSIEGNRATINNQDFKKYFGNDYSKVKTPFLENRMVVGRKMSTIELNFDMVVIAYSTYLITLFNEVDTSLSTEEIADFFKQRLEPYDNDNMANIAYIIFLLSLEKNFDMDKKDLSKIYSGILYLWFDNHNATICTENLDFWSKSDFSSFIDILDIIELGHVDFDRPFLKDTMLEILIMRWRNSQGKDKDIEYYLSDLLLWRDNINDTKIFVRRAIKIIFSKPTNVFLDRFLDLAKELNDEESEVKIHIRYELERQISILLRYGYTEDIFDYIKSKKEYHVFADMFKSYNLSRSMGHSLHRRNYEYTICALVEKFKTGSKIFDGFALDNIHKFPDLIPVAAREDLEFIQSDKETIKDVLVELVDDYSPSQYSGQGRRGDVDVEFLTLLTSFDVVAFNKIIQSFLYKSVISRADTRDINKYDFVILPNKRLAHDIMANLDSLMNIEDKERRDRYINKLIEIMLFCADEKMLITFFDIIIDKSYSVCLPLELAYYIKHIAGRKFLSVVNKKIEKFHAKNHKDNVLYEQYMTYLHIMDDQKNIHLKEWILAKASKCDGETKLNKFQAEIYVLLLSASEYFDKFDVKDILPTNGNFIQYWVTKEHGLFNETSIEELSEKLPMDAIGNLLYRNKRYSELEQWCEMLFEGQSSFSTMLFGDIEDPLKICMESNKELFLKRTVKFLNHVSNSGFVFTGGLKDILLEILLHHDFDKAMEFHDKDSRKNLDNNIIRSLFDVRKFPEAEYKSRRKAIIDGTQNDYQYLEIVIMSFHGSTESEVFEICRELLESKYAIDRKKAISMLMWFDVPEIWNILHTLSVSDDSEYVREYALWAEQVALQEKFTRKICKEAFEETDKEKLAAKLFQIKDSLTPTFLFWGNDLIDNCRESDKKIFDKIYIKRFLDRTEKNRELSDKFEILGRKLSDYYLGEKTNNDMKYILGLT